MVLSPVTGATTYRVPGGRTVRLRAATRVPLRSIVDAGHSTVRVTTAQGPRASTQAIDVRAGSYSAAQSAPAGQEPMTTIALEGRAPARCRVARSAASGSPISYEAYRRLVLHERRPHGKIGIRGRHSRAIAKGTTFTVEDSCAGTRSSVSEGTIDVTPLDSRLPVRVTPGKFAFVACESATQTCTLVVRSNFATNPSLNRDFFQVVVTTYGFLTSPTYDLCLTAPESPEHCRTFSLGARSADGLRLSEIGCFSSDAGRYVARWRIGGRQVGKPLAFVLPNVDQALPTIGGYCKLERTGDGPMAAIPEPGFQYGPSVPGS
jgi:hypothetical protein